MKKPIKYWSPKIQVPLLLIYIFLVTEMLLGINYVIPGSNNYIVLSKYTDVHYSKYHGDTEYYLECKNYIGTFSIYVSPSTYNSAKVGSSISFDDPITANELEFYAINMQSSRNVTANTVFPYSLFIGNSWLQIVCSIIGLFTIIAFTFHEIVYIIILIINLADKILTKYDVDFDANTAI